MGFTIHTYILGSQRMQRFHQRTLESLGLNILHQGKQCVCKVENQSLPSHPDLNLIVSKMLTARLHL